MSSRFATHLIFLVFAAFVVSHAVAADRRLRSENNEGETRSRVAVLGQSESAILTSFRLAADGTRLVTGHGDGVVRVWEYPSGRMLCHFALEHEYASNAKTVRMALAGDGKTLATTGDGWLRLWDVVAGRAASAIRAAEPSAADDIRALLLRNDAAGEAAWRLIHSGALTTDGTPWSIDELGIVRKWDLQHRIGKPQFDVLNDFSKTTDVVLTNDGGHALLGDKHGRVGLWDLSTREQTRVVMLDDVPHAIASRGNANSEFVALGTSAVHFGNLESGKVLATWRLADRVSELRHVNAKSQRALTQRSNTIMVWDARGNLIQQLRCDDQSLRKFGFLRNGDGVWALTVGPWEGTYGEEDSDLVVWNESRGWQSDRIIEFARRLCVDVSPEGAIAAMIRAGVIEVHDLDEKRIVRQIAVQEEDSEVLESVRLSASGAWVALSSKNRTKVWATSTGDLMGEFDGWFERFSDGGHLQTRVWSYPEFVDRHRLWHLKTGREISRLDPDSFFVGHRSLHAFCVSPNGRFAATGGGTGEIILWNLSDGAIAGTLKGHGGIVTCLAFSPDGRFLFSGSSDKTVRFWSTTALTLERTVPTEKSMHSIQPTRDGTSLLVGDDIGVWTLPIPKPK